MLAPLLMAEAPAVSPAAEPATLSARWAAGWSAKDLDGLMALYAPEPVFLTASGERWEGAATIRAHFAEGLAEYNPQLTVKSLKSEASGDLAYDSGSYEETTTAVHGSGGAIRAKGSYLFVFQRQTDGSWKILEQVWTQRGVARM
jgi:uncharacterized protein (TIGR02246 family)